jgi:hypothetical protein
MDPAARGTSDGSTESATTRAFYAHQLRSTIRVYTWWVTPPDEAAYGVGDALRPQAIPKPMAMSA